MRGAVLHPAAVPGAQYAPIPRPPVELYWVAGQAVSVHRGSTQADQPGPHLDPPRCGADEPTPRIADLRDPDTALLVLRRLLATPQRPVRAHTLAQLLLGGRWGQDQAVSLGELCAQAWAKGPR